MSKAIAAILALVMVMGFTRQSEVDCLARNIYHEAGNSTRLDERAVAHVTINRKNSGQFPNTICGVVYQPRQFKWTRNEPPTNNTVTWNRSREIAFDALARRSQDPTNGATYFWSSRLHPRWTRNLTVTLTTRAHIYAK